MILTDFMDFDAFSFFSRMMCQVPETWESGKLRPADALRTFARFQDGFLASEDFHRVLKVSHRFSWFSLLIIDLQRFLWFFVDLVC